MKLHLDTKGQSRTFYVDHVNKLTQWEDPRCSKRQVDHVHDQQNLPAPGAADDEQSSTLPDSPTPSSRSTKMPSMVTPEPNPSEPQVGKTAANTLLHTTLGDFCAKVAAMLGREIELCRTDLDDCRELLDTRCAHSDNGADDANEVFYDAEEAVTYSGTNSMHANNGTAHAKNYDAQHTVGAMLECLRAMQLVLHLAPTRPLPITGELTQLLDVEPQRIIQEWCGTPETGGVLFNYYNQVAMWLGTDEAHGTNVDIRTLHSNFGIVKLLVSCDKWVDFDAMANPFAELQVSINSTIQSRETDEKLVLDFALKEFDLDSLGNFKDKQLDAQTIAKVGNRIMAEASMLQSISLNLQPRDRAAINDVFDRFQYLSTRANKIGWCLGSTSAAENLTKHLAATQKAFTGVFQQLLADVRDHVAANEFFHAETLLKFVGDMLPPTESDPSSPFAGLLQTTQRTRRYVDEYLTVRDDAEDQLLGTYCTRCDVVLLENPTEHELQAVRENDGLLIFVASGAEGGATPRQQLQLGGVGDGGVSHKQSQSTPLNSGSKHSMHSDPHPPTLFSHDEWVNLRDRLFTCNNSTDKRHTSAQHIAKAMNILQDDYSTRMNTVGIKGSEIAEYFAIAPNGIMQQPWQKNPDGRVVTSLFVYIDLLKTNKAISSDLVHDLHQLRILGNNARHPHLPAFTVCDTSFRITWCNTCSGFVFLQRACGIGTLWCTVAGNTPLLSGTPY